MEKLIFCNLDMLCEKFGADQTPNTNIYRDEFLKKYEPENIIIEPSGVAKLSEIIKILEE